MRRITTVINYYAQCTNIVKSILYIVHLRFKNSLLTVCSRGLLLSPFYVMKKKPRELGNFLGLDV